jgi:hypothetical protein
MCDTAGQCAVSCAGSHPGFDEWAVGVLPSAGTSPIDGSGSANAEMAATIASWAALTSGWAARNSEVNQRSTTALAIAALPPARTVAARSVQAEAGRPLSAGAEQGEPVDPLGVAGPDPRAVMAPSDSPTRSARPMPSWSSSESSAWSSMQ